MIRTNDEESKNFARIAGLKKNIVKIKVNFVLLYSSKI